MRGDFERLSWEATLISEKLGLERLPGLGLSLRPVISVLSVGLFAGLNILGARSTGLTEDILVG